MTISDLHDFCRRHSKIFCYGAGRYGRTLWVHLQERGIDIEAFLITGEPPDDDVLGKPVRSIHEMTFAKGDGVILAISSRFIGAMQRELALQGVQEYAIVDERLLEEIESATEFSHCLSKVPYINVLMYHRVAEESRDSYEITVSPGNFAEQMAYLNENFPVLRFDDEWERITKPSVVVTFDDGYADNFHNALPVLERYNIPVTFFVSTEHLGTNDLFWWDILDGLFSACLDGSIRLGNRQFNRNELKAANSFLRKMLPEKRNDIIDEAMRKATELPKTISKRRILSIKELKQLSESSLVTIGAHTVTHSSLSHEPKTVQEWEIKASKRRLEDIIGRELSVFSYPFGDYNEETLSILKDCGIKKACTVAGGLYSRNDFFRIPRNKVLNVNGREFEKFMEKCYCIYA